MLMKVTILLDNSRSMLNISVVLPVDLDLDTRYDVYINCRSICLEHEGDDKLPPSR